jgi:hypothetical protein
MKFITDKSDETKWQRNGTYPLQENCSVLNLRPHAPGNWAVNVVISMKPCGSTGISTDSSFSESDTLTKSILYLTLSALFFLRYYLLNFIYLLIVLLIDSAHALSYILIWEEFKIKCVLVIFGYLFVNPQSISQYLI